MNDYNKPTAHHTTADVPEGWGKYIIGGLILAAIVVGLILFLDVDQVEEGNLEMPRVSVEGGDVDLPEFDVETADVDVRLPRVDVDVEGGELDVDLPKEGTEADDISPVDGMIDENVDVDVDVDVDDE